jgi:hypothetical protein
VPFRNFQRLQNVSAAKAYLAKEVLAEVPEQIVGYMKSRNVKPRQPQTQQSTNASNMASPPPYSKH